MKAELLDAGRPESFQPLTCTRDLAACPVANRSLREWQLERLAQAGFDGEPEELALTCSGAAWLSPALLEELRSLTHPAVIRDVDQTPLAWLNISSALPEVAQCLSLDDTSRHVLHPWDLLAINEELAGALDRDTIQGEVSPGVTIEGHITLGPGSRLLPGVFIEGNAVIGANCKIGPNCYIRGSTSIGDNCHLGQAVEIKNAILMDGVGIGHLSYCGDSIVGAGTNFGAGTITANFRHDGARHRSMVDGELIDTGRRKLGAIIGDDVHTGIHTSIYPGRKIWPHQSTRPGDIVQKDLR